MHQRNQKAVQRTQRHGNYLKSKIAGRCRRISRAGSPRLCREITQRADAWKKEIGTSANGHKLRNANCTFANSRFLRLTELVDACSAEQRFAISHERIFLVLQPGELSVRRPCALHKFKLPANIGPQADEVKSAFPGRFFFQQSCVGCYRVPVKTTPAQDAVKSC